jgi:hypothetical protein
MVTQNISKNTYRNNAVSQIGAGQTSETNRLWYQVAVWIAEHRRVNGGSNLQFDGGRYCIERPREIYLV